MFGSTSRSRFRKVPPNNNGIHCPAFLPLANLLSTSSCNLISNISKLPLICGRSACFVDRTLEHELDGLHLSRSIRYYVSWTSEKSLCVLQNEQSISNSHVRILSNSQFEDANVIPPHSIAQLPISTKRPYGYWKREENILHELAEYISKRENDFHRLMSDSSVIPSTSSSMQSAFSDPDFLRTMPTATELNSAGFAPLAGAISRKGWANIAKLAGLKLSSVARPRSLNLVLSARTHVSGDRPMKPYRYWVDFSNLEREIKPYIKSNRLPTAQELVNLGRSDLRRGITKHGGWIAVGLKLGVLARSTKPELKGWEDEASVCKELKRIMYLVAKNESCLLSEHQQRRVLVSLKKRHLEQYGKPGIVQAVKKHGGMGHLLFEVRESYDCWIGYFKDLERLNLANEFVRIMKLVHENRGRFKAHRGVKDRHGAIFLALTRRHLEAYGNPELMNIVKRHGGLRYMLEYVRTH